MLLFTMKRGHYENPLAVNELLPSGTYSFQSHRVHKCGSLINNELTHKYLL